MGARRSLVGDNMLDGVSPVSVKTRPHRCLEAVQRTTLSPLLAHPGFVGAGRVEIMLTVGDDRAGGDDDGQSGIVYTVSDGMLRSV